MDALSLGGGGEGNLLLPVNKGAREHGRALGTRGVGAATRSISRVEHSLSLSLRVMKLCGCMAQSGKRFLFRGTRGCQGCRDVAGGDDVVAPRPTEGDRGDLRRDSGPQAETGDLDDGDIKHQVAHELRVVLDAVDPGVSGSIRQINGGRLDARRWSFIADARERHGV